MGSMDFPPSSFDAVISFYALEHIPRDEHEAMMKRIYRWLKGGGFLLISMEAGDYQDAMGEWLGVPMFFSCFRPEEMRRILVVQGFDLLETAIENQVEQGVIVPYHWIFASKP